MLFTLMYEKTGQLYILCLQKFLILMGQQQGHRSHVSKTKLASVHAQWLCPVCKSLALGEPPTHWSRPINDSDQ